MVSVTRRSFCASLPVALAWSRSDALQAPQTSRPDVAAIDRGRILAAANKALVTDPVTLLALSRQLSALAAAFHLTRDESYAAQATLVLHTWFLHPVPLLNVTTTTHFERILDTIPLAEIAQSIPFFARSASLPAQELPTIKAWFADYLSWLTTSRTAGLARDQKDHHGASWFFQSAAYARLTGNESVLAELRHRFKTVLLRAQLVAAGTFPHELTTPYPYRNSLFALDLLAAACQLLSTPFDNLWEFELQDGPGLHVAMARHYPYIVDRGAWPYRADLDHFTDLPGRRPSLLFAARAYTRPEYAALWRTLNPDLVPELQSTLPLSQPLLWVVRA